jgi:transposase-like protein
MGENRKKAAIVASYLSGKYSYRDLMAKHGYGLATLHRWVKQYSEILNNAEIKEKVREPLEAPIAEMMPSDIKELQAELRKSRLMNELLTTIIDIAEEQLKVPIRKKYGTRQS